MFVCCECRVLSGRGLCDELITRPEKSYRLCCVVVCDLETSRVGAPYIYIYIYIYIYDISRLRVTAYLFYSSIHLFLCIAIFEVVRKEKIFSKLHIGYYNIKQQTLKSQNRTILY